MSGAATSAIAAATSSRCRIAIGILRPLLPTRRSDPETSIAAQGSAEAEMMPVALDVPSENSQLAVPAAGVVVADSLNAIADGDGTEVSVWV